MPSSLYIVERFSEVAEFPDENGRFPCLEQMEEDIYIVEDDDKPQQ